MDSDSTSRGRAMIIAEVAQAHDGSLGLAHAFIDAVANAGVDAIKFQTHIAAAESTLQEPWRIKFSQQDATRYDYWKRMEFSEEQWRGLKSHAGARGLQFLSSPFSIEAVELLTRVGVSAWKVASGEVNNESMFAAMVQTKLPVILSSGMSSLAEIDGAVARVKAASLPITLLQCTSMYPTPPEKVGLNLIPFFRERYGCGVGLSDHSGTIYAGLAAAAIGVDALELHVTLSREMFGPDVPASITTRELRQLIEGVRFIEKARANPVDKNALSEILAPVRDLFTKSIVARIDLAVGTVLQESHLAMKKPGTGLSAAHLKEIVGRTLAQSVRADQILQLSDLV